MNEEQQDEKIRRLFRELRTRDARSAPSFHATWQAAAERDAFAKRIPWFNRAFAVAAAVLVLAVVGAVWFQSRTNESQPVEIASVSYADWQSPTAFLLELPGAGLWKDTPSLDQSWMQRVSEVNEAME